MGAARVAKRVERLLAPYQGDDVPGIAVLVARDGEPLLVRTHGSANLAEDTRVGPATNFRLASITKQFTATCIMMLVERGALSLDATLPELFGGFPTFGRDITLRDLLRHTSGLIDYESLIGPDCDGQVSDRDVLRVALGSGRTYFEPGTHFRYSNTGYALLAVLVEQVSGASFAEFLEANIFSPLSMTATVALQPGVSVVKNRAMGYTIHEDGSATLSDQDACSAVLGDGGIYSSLVDYGKWDQALYGNTLVSQGTLDGMWTPSWGGYGYGWRIDQFAGLRRLHHEGFSCGFRNHVMRFPDERLTVLVLTNRREPAVQPIADFLARLYLS